MTAKGLSGCTASSARAAAPARSLRRSSLFAFFLFGLGFRLLDLAGESDLLLTKDFELSFQVGVRHGKSGMSGVIG